MAEAKRMVRIMKDDEVTRITALPRNTRYDMTARGEFPAPVWVTRRTRGYMSDEIEAWLESRRQRRSIAQAKPWRPETAQGATP